MPVFRIVTTIAAPIEVCFDLSRSIDLHVDSMAASRERAVGGVTSGLIGAGQEVSWAARHFGLRWHVTSRITAFDRPHGFTDQMVRGPFTVFRHEHRFAEHGATAETRATQMTDVVEFRMGFGPLRPIAELAAGAYLRRLMAIWNEAIVRRAERG